MAVGATQHDIVRLVLRDGVSLVGFGLATGSLIALASSRVVESFLFGISPHDPLVLVSVPPILGCVALLACAIPGWRAARIDPTIALHSE